MSIENNRLELSEYLENFSDIHPPLTESKAYIESNRCLYCYDAPCTKACPTDIDIPLFIKQISSGNRKGSAKTILSSNIMGAGCARVCPTEKLCEGACVCKGFHEDPIPIGLLQRYSTDLVLEENLQLFDRKDSIGKKVAVVGAGPAGLSCAHRLAREGVEVDIFERESKSGGLMTYGVAAYKVDRDFSTKEVDWILSLGGMNIHYNTELGKDIQLADLQKDYDAVFLGLGLGGTRELEIPGEDTNGVYDAISFIYDIRAKDYGDVSVGDKVAVIGMGMTAIDAATQSKRLGAADVTMVYRRTEKEKPCTDKEHELAKLDGVQMEYLASPKEIKSGSNGVEALVLERMKLGEPDDSGRRRPVGTGETFEIEVDMVIKATGQLPFDINGSMHKDLGTKWGRIEAKDDRSTNLDKVYSGGDCINGGAEVVDAVQDGKIAAATILKSFGVEI